MSLMAPQGATKAGGSAAKQFLAQHAQASGLLFRYWRNSMKIKNKLLGSNDWLRSLSSAEGSPKWADAYVRRLGILEHCDEIITLHRSEAVAKAEGRKGTFAQAIEREIADLWCIIQMHRMSDGEFKKLCNERALRFRP